MKLLKDKISRLAIYFFYDNDGIVDGFIEYFIKEILKCTDRLVIVCNGKLSEDGEHKLSGFTPLLLNSSSILSLMFIFSFEPAILNTLSKN